MALPASPKPAPPEPRRPVMTPGAVQPRSAAPDSFEQNPLSQVAERISLQATEGMDDATRVREALRIVIAEGISINEAARRCSVAPSCIITWRKKYVALLSEEPSIASGPLLDPGGVQKNADLVIIPGAAREQFAENWERLVKITRATPSTFRQNPVQVFLENSWMTSWLYADGKLDRAVFAGAAVALTVMVLTATFLTAGHFYRRETIAPPAPLNYDDAIQAAAAVAQQYFAAPTAEEKSQFVRLNDDIRPGFHAYFQKHPASAITDARLDAAIPGDGLLLLKFQIPSLDRAHQCIVLQRDGQFLLDWETSSWFQEANIEDLRRTKPTAPVRIAVRVIQESYYNFGFKEQKYTCFHLSYPGLPLTLYGYARKDSPEDTTLRALLTPVTTAERPVSAILSVKFPPGSTSADNQVEIIRILSPDWVAK